MLLRDAEILKLLVGGASSRPLIKNFQVPNPTYGKTSPIQPASLDLHIGLIFSPETDEDGYAGLNRGAIELLLQPGETAVITTEEELLIPPNIAGFGFPPTRISANGILMTNPGHIDPGFEGPLKFTIINMSRKPFLLRRGDTVVTCLLAELKRAADMDYAKQGHKAASPRPRHEIDQLSKDFLSLEQRSESIANSVAAKHLKDLETLITKREIVAAVIGMGALLVALLPIYIAFIPPLLDLKERVSEAKFEVRLREIEKKIENKK